MRSLLSTAAVAAMFAFAAAPAASQQLPAKGKEAVAIVEGGTIRAAEGGGLQGFLLLIEYQGRNYTCTVNATGRVQGCFPLYW